MDSHEIQLSAKELQLYEKPADSTWFMTKEVKRIEEYEKVNITILSPYSFRVSEDDRPSDYFDRRETILDFNDFENRVSIKIVGKGREEHMDVKINGKPMRFEGEGLVLSMNKTFSEEDMALLLRKAQRQSDGSIKIGDSLEVWTATFLKEQSHLRVEA